MREILEQLLPYYKANYEKAKGKWFLFTLKWFLKDKCMHHGICHCAAGRFLRSIYGLSWVEANKSYYDYWFEKPEDGKTKAEVLRAIEVRIDIMQRLYDSTN